MFGQLTLDDDFVCHHRRRCCQRRDLEVGRSRSLPSSRGTRRTATTTSLSSLLVLVLLATTAMVITATATMLVDTSGRARTTPVAFEAPCNSAVLKRRRRSQLPRCEESSRTVLGMGGYSETTRTVTTALFVGDHHRSGNNRSRCGGSRRRHEAAAAPTSPSGGFEGRINGMVVGRRRSGSGTNTFTRLCKSSNANSSLDPPLRQQLSMGGTPSSEKKKLQTFQRYLEIECWKRRDLRNLEPVLASIAQACRQINRIVQRAQTDDLYGAALASDGSVLDENVQGETQQKLDVLCNEIMLRSFCACGGKTIGAVASEEEDVPRKCLEVLGMTPDIDRHADGMGRSNAAGSRTSYGVGGSMQFQVGEFVAVFDPIDGSKNIDSSLPVGTVFGIYRSPPGMRTAAVRRKRRPVSQKKKDGKKESDPAVGGKTTDDDAAAEAAANDDDDEEEDDRRKKKQLEEAFLQRGDAMVAAGYCLYSATTVLVLTLGSGVDGFTLDPDYGTFLHTHRDIRIPPTGQIYSVNEANFRDFDEPVRRYLDALKGGNSASTGTKCSARYIGALVGDVHNILMQGGIFAYPATVDNPDGKLRLLYECCPMAMIMEQAGGAASTGHGRILHVLPKEIHQRSPVFLGSIENVFEVDQFHRYYGEEQEEEEDVYDDDYYMQKLNE